MMEIVKTFLVFMIYVAALLAAVLVLWGVVAASRRLVKMAERRTRDAGGKRTDSASDC
jgi:hypothetical protein